MAAFTLYDILRELVRASRIAEDQRLAMIESIGEAENLAVLGNTAVNIQCDHPGELDPSGYCGSCGRRVESRDPSSWAARRRGTFFETNIPR